MDVMPCESVEVYKCCLDTIDHGISWLWTFGLKTKSEAELHIRHWIKSLQSTLREVRVDCNIWDL